MDIIRQKRRKDGKDGWKKDECHWSRTGWAWWKEDKRHYFCTCEPCQPKKVYNKESALAP